MLSGRLWRFVRDAPFKPREETITEGLLVAMHRLKGSSTYVTKSTTAEEVKDGHDFLWGLRSVDGKRWLHLRVQAKMLFPSGYYEGLGKDKAGNKKAQAQVAALLQAKAAGQLPVYVFYNGEALPFGADGHPGVGLGCGRSPLTRGLPAKVSPATSPLGVTLVDADWVRFHIENKPEPASPKWAITGHDLNPGAVPWECITCPMLTPPCDGPLPKDYLLGRARQALNGPVLDLPLGVSTQPQPWAALLQQGQSAGAWRTLTEASSEDEEVDLDEADPDSERDSAYSHAGEEGDRSRTPDPSSSRSPDYLVVTHLGAAASRDL